ncbi:MAG: DinB family protein [Janthinobacterium lividum]
MSEESALARPYVHLLEGRDPVAVMRETPGQLADLLKTLSPEQIERKPAPHKWSIREILCHLADCEIVWAWRMRQIYGAENPTLQPFEQDPWSRAYDGVGYTTAAARTTWTALRQWNLDLIEGLSEGDKHRPAQHLELGPVTLETVIEIVAGHDLHHLDSLAKLAHTQLEA